SEPPAPPAQGRRVQNVVGLCIAEAALAFLIEDKPEYLRLAKKWMDAATSYDIWGYAYNKPNVDLAAGHLLFGLGWGYDLLYEHLDEGERKKYRGKLVKQARLLYEHYRLKPGRSFAYSQNHVYIPNAGLAVAAYALYGEVPEAADWAELSRLIVQRSLDTYSADGYFYESFEYWVFAVPWLVIWTTAHEHFTGETVHDRPGFREMHRYLAHIVLPGAKDVFDFGDAYSGSETRDGTVDDHARTHPGGKLHSNYNLLHATAAWFQDAEAQGVAKYFEDQGHVTWYAFMSLLWFDADLKAKPLTAQPTYHYFSDHEVVFYRSSWGPDATALAFKSGPPEGHATLKRRAQMPDWHLSSGHAHPDANSFILVSGGEYLTGDSGYSGVPRTDQHNTVLVDGHGQRFTEEGHNAFRGADYAQLNRIRLDVKSLGPKGVHAVGDATFAYPSQLGLRRFTRELRLEGNAVTLVDRLEADGAQTFTSLFHSDGPISVGSDGSIQTRRGERTLRIAVQSDQELSTEVEPNWMTGPGRPGSVQKGKRESRGYRARVRNAAKTKALTLTSKLSF
ncbi:MAG: heparinase II/III family protein, partial [Myxococcota bacterium]